MGILDGLSNWFEPPSRSVYRCSDCGSLFEEAHSSCPECEGEIEADETFAYYWGVMWSIPV